MRNKILSSLLYCSVVLLFISGLVFYRNNKQHPTVRDIKGIKKTAELQYRPRLPGLDSIFVEDHSWTATLSAKKISRILVTGDIIPARSVNAGVIRRSNPLWPYEKVSPFINSLSADLVFVSLETPLLKNCPVTVEGMLFCGSEINIEGLKAIGADVVSVANNHFGNHGANGIAESLSLIENENMFPVGTSGPVYKTVNGTKFAFLAFNDIEKLNNGLNIAEESFITAQLKTARSNADTVIVMYHWGTEYRNQPDERQIYLAHFTIDQGADLVVSNHPHWVQPVEIYKNKLIMYAHGNFIFDQMWSEETRIGVLGLYTFYESQLIDVNFFPLKIFDYGQPRFLESSEKEIILNNLKMESLKLREAIKK